MESTVNCGLLLSDDGLNKSTAHVPLTRSCRADALLMRKSKALQHIIKPSSHLTAGWQAGRWNRTEKCAKRLELDRKKGRM